MAKLTDMLNDENGDRREREDEVLRQLHDRLRSEARKWIWRRCQSGRPPLLQTDVLVDDAYLREIRDGRMIGRWENREHFVRYCANKMHDFVIEELRKRQRELARQEGAGADELNQVESREASAEAIAEAADEEERLRAALDRLPDRLGELVQRYYFLGQSLREIGAAFDCAWNTVRARLLHAQELLRQALEDPSIDFELGPDEPQPA